VEFRNVRIKELPSLQVPKEITAPEDQGWRHLYTGVDFRNWRVPVTTQDRWKVNDWQIQLNAGQTGAALWTEEEFGDVEVICDVFLPKNVDLNKPAAGICVRGHSHPLVMFGSGGLASVSLGSDQVKPGAWYRIKAALTGSQAEIIVTEKQELHPQIFRVELDASARGRIGLADLTQAVSYANIFVRSL
jgi:hypothetical protein